MAATCVELGGQGSGKCGKEVDGVRW